MKLALLFCISILNFQQALAGGGIGGVCQWVCGRDPGGAACASCSGNSKNNQEFEQLFEINNLSHPESALIHGESIFISEMGPDTEDIKNADGDLVKYFLNGKKDQGFTLRAPLHSPMGMAIKDDLIFVADIDRVVAIDLASGEKAYEVSLEEEGANFLNDLVLVKRKWLLVTATNLKKVFAINLETQNYIELELDLKGSAPNGLAYDGKNGALYIAANERHELGEPGNGRLLERYLDENLRLIPSLSRSAYLGKFLDGVTLDDKSIYLSDWYGFGNDGRVYRLNKELFLERTIPFHTAGLADFHYSPERKLLVTPNLTEGKARIYKK